MRSSVDLWSLVEGLVNDEVATIEVVAIQTLDSLFGTFWGAQLDEEGSTACTILVLEHSGSLRLVVTEKVHDLLLRLVVVNVGHEDHRAAILLLSGGVRVVGILVVEVVVVVSEGDLGSVVGLGEVGEGRSAVDAVAVSSLRVVDFLLVEIVEASSRLVHAPASSAAASPAAASSTTTGSTVVTSS